MYYFYAQTVKGLKCQKNNDSFFINNYISQMGDYKTQSKKNEFIIGVADGVGSSMFANDASKYLFEKLSKYKNQITHALVLNIIKNTHKFLQKTYSYQASTVFTIVHIQDALITIYHLGDTRAYKLTPHKNLIRLTNDHSYVQKLIDEGVISEDMRYSHPQKNIILQSLGGEKDIRIDVYKSSLEPGEKLLLTTDGIHDYVDDHEIKNILLDSQNIERNVSNLIANAQNANSKDDLTALIVKCT